MSKTHDLVVVTGEYQKGGETKKRYQNVGAVVEGQHGPYIVLESWFNPAGVQKDGRVYLSMYPADSGRNSQGGADSGQSSHRTAKNTQDGGFDQDIPFN